MNYEPHGSLLIQGKGFPDTYIHLENRPGPSLSIIPFCSQMLHSVPLIESMAGVRGMDARRAKLHSQAVSFPSSLVARKTQGTPQLATSRWIMKMDRNVSNCKLGEKTQSSPYTSWVIQDRAHMNKVVLVLLDERKIKQTCMLSRGCRKRLTTGAQAKPSTLRLRNFVSATSHTRSQSH